MESRRIILFVIPLFFLSFSHYTLLWQMECANVKRITVRYWNDFWSGFFPFLFFFFFFFFFFAEGASRGCVPPPRPIRKITRSTTTDDDWARLRQRGHVPVVVALVSLRMSHSTGNQHHGRTIFVQCVVVNNDAN